MMKTEKLIFTTTVWLIIILINGIFGHEDGYCAPYNGKICKSYIKSTQVFYSGSGGWENEKVTTGLFAELIEDLDDLCQKPASKLLCSYAFPKCKIIDGVATKLPLCYEDCIAVKFAFCFNYWVLLEEKKSKGQNLKNRGHFRLPDCEALPRYNKSTKYPSCSFVGITDMNPAEITCKLLLFNKFKK